MTLEHAQYELTAGGIDEHLNSAISSRAVPSAGGTGEGPGPEHRPSANVKKHDTETEPGMNGARPKGGQRTASHLRPEIPKADYHDEVTPEAMAKLRKVVADINDPKRQRTRISGFDWPLTK